MLDILAVTAPFFGLVLAGWAATRLRWLPLASIPGLNGFVLFFALPCMLFRFAAGTPIAQLMDAGVVTLYLLSAGLMVALTIATTRRRLGGWNDASFGALVAAFPNSGFIGVPLLVALLGERAAAPAIVALAIDMVATSSLCIALSRLGAAGPQGAGQAVAGALRGMVSNPLPWAIALGSLSSASGVAAPPLLMDVVTLLADAASPVALFALGGVLARGQMNAQPGAPPHAAAGGVAQAVAFKLLLHPLLVFGLGRLAIAFGAPLDPYAAMVLVLVAALPSASNVPMLAERFRADASRLARIVLFSTVGAFLSFSAAVALLSSR